MDYVTVEQWNMIFAKTGEAIIFADNNGVIESLNPAALQLLEGNSGEIIGQSITEIFKIATPDSPDEVAVSIPENEDTVSLNEVVLQRKNGEKTWISCSFTKIPGGDGLGDKVIIFARDISESKKLDQMRSDFISIASHELRTPLTVISGYLSLLLSAKVGKLTDPQENFVRQIYEDTQSLSSLVEDLLDISRLDSGKFRLHKTALLLPDILKRTVDSLSEKALERKIQILYTPETNNIPQFYGDKSKIRQVLTNIIDNAIKYTNPSGKIRISFRVTDGVFVITVADNGYGIEKKDLSHIFDRFFRAENKILDRVTGAGLGLYISKTIIEMHSGTIVVDSIFEKGTTFTITLPRDLIFERGHEVKVAEKAPNVFQQFLSNFLHNKSRKENTYD